MKLLIVLVASLCLVGVFARDPPSRGDGARSNLNVDSGVPDKVDDGDLLDSDREDGSNSVDDPPGSDPPTERPQPPPGHPGQRHPLCVCNCNCGCPTPPCNPETEPHHLHWKNPAFPPASATSNSSPSASNSLPAGSSSAAKGTAPPPQ